MVTDLEQTWQCCLVFAGLLDLSRVTSQASGLADISVMCSLGSEFGSTSSLAQEWRKLVDLCSDLQETDYEQQPTNRFVTWRTLPQPVYISSFV